MKSQVPAGGSLGEIIAEIKNDIDLLYKTRRIFSRHRRHLVLDHLRDKILMLEVLTGATAPNQTTFTPEELAKFDGKNGNPAYVAVKGTVYDVTDNAAWASATHFGLTAGKDLTGEFASCHPGQPILDQLKVVGVMV